MSQGELKQGQVIPLIFTIKDQDDNVVDISGATVKKIIIDRPGLSQLIVDGAFVTNGTDGQIQYVTKPASGNNPADLQDVGDYQFQAKITVGGIEYPSDIFKKAVTGNL